MTTKLNILNLNIGNNESITEHSLEFRKSQLTIAKKTKTLSEFIITKLITRIKELSNKDDKYDLYLKTNYYYFFLNISILPNTKIKKILSNLHKQFFNISQDRQQ